MRKKIAQPRKTLPTKFVLARATWDTSLKAPAPIIAYYVRKAYQDQLWALDLTASWYKTATPEALARAARLLSQTVHEIARAAINERRLVEAEFGCFPASGFTVPWERYRNYGVLMTRADAICRVIRYEPIELVSTRRDDRFAVIGREIVFGGRVVALLCDTLPTTFEDYVVEVLEAAETGAIPKDEHDKRIADLEASQVEELDELEGKFKALETEKDALEAELDAITEAGSIGKRYREVKADLADAVKSKDAFRAKLGEFSTANVALAQEVASLTAQLRDAQKALRGASYAAKHAAGKATQLARAIKNHPFEVIQGGRKAG